jgi:alpha-tubulin suppressor-like RCC1 family protein
LAGTTPLNEVVAVAAGALHGLALTADGRVWSWGANNWGQLGDGSMTPRSSASEVLTPTGVLTDIVGVAAGDKHSLALDRQGRVWSWGSSSSGQVGNGATASRTRAEPLSGVSGIVAIAAGGDSSLAVSGSNSLWVWGRNVDGQLGDGSTANRLLPVKVAAGVKAAACGGAFILRQLLGGSVLGTGANEQGQLGDGSSASPRIEPVATIGSGDISAIELGSSHTLLLRTDGSVRGTGRNVAGQVGNGTTETQLSLVPAEPLDDAVGLAAGGDHSLAVDHHGRVFAWGENSLGQLGLGDTKDRRVPTPLPGFAVASTDPDGDGLSTQEELALGTDPFVADTNHDGISDGTAFRAGLSMTDADMDDDGVANGTELAAGTDPFRSDSDEDGVSDAADCYPRDPSRSACLPPDPLDSTPPALTLVEPAGAVLISSLP